MKPLFITSAGTIFLFVAPLSFLFAQDGEFAFFGDDTIAISSEQSERFDELEEGLGTAVDSMRDEIKKLQTEYEAKRKFFETARLNLLTPAQKAELQKTRRTRLLNESAQQESRDIDFLAEFLPILRDMKTIKALSVLEGPQRTGNGEIQPPNSNDTVIFVGKHYFFSSPLKLDEDDELSLTSTVRNYKSFAAYAGGKMCGGFHPDANIQIKTANTAISMLICFGCSEARIISGDVDRMVELEPHAYSTLRTICYRHFRKHDDPHRVDQR
jgi:hypothetical protein